MDFKDKVVLITGAASGIGRATALSFAEKGAKVVLADIAEDNGQRALREVQALSPESLFVATNVADSNSVQNMVRQTVARFGRIDVAVNNAGISGTFVPTAEFPEAEWHQITSVNLTGVFLCMKYELQEMVKAKQGCIVNTASVAGLVGYPNSPCYVAAKHGVVGLTRGAALEYAPLGIRVNAVCPGIIETPMTDPANNRAMLDFLASLHPLKRTGQAEEVAGAIVWLASSHASYVTGHALPVDGGYAAQ
jgi:NAD(P)-dependent dehydrogenase (short-subunit alcohol dehydrogenase family)